MKVGELQAARRPWWVPLRAGWAPTRSRLRASRRLARALLHAAKGLLVAQFVFPLLDRRHRERRISRWAAGMFRALGLRVELRGRLVPGAKLVVANHVCWLDIMALHVHCPEARFVAMAELRHWSAVARLVDAARTIYLQRRRPRDLLRVVHEVADALAAGDTVAVFPEGIVGDGQALLPFHGNLLQAALIARAPVQPVALRYAGSNGATSPAALFTGTITLGQSLWRLASAEGLVLQMQVLPALTDPVDDRRALAERARAAIAAALAGPGAA